MKAEGGEGSEGPGWGGGGGSDSGKVQKVEERANSLGCGYLVEPKGQ